jgi:hypothetical protein
MRDPDDDRSLLDELFGADAPEDAQDVDVEDVAVAGGTDDAAAAAARGASRRAGHDSEPDRRRHLARRPGVPRSRSPSTEQAIGAPATDTPAAEAPSTEAPATGRTVRQRSALSESGLPQTTSPAGERRMPAWREAVWERTGVRPSAAPGCREIGLTTTGFVIFVMVDSIMMYTPFSTPGSTSLLPQALTLALLAFGLGGLLVWSIRGAFRPVGLGIMLGWVFMTLISAGYFTGLNP